MNEAEAISRVSRLAAGLSPDPAGVSRLLERIAQSGNGDELRAALVERGAGAVLDGVSKAGLFHRIDPSCRRNFSSR